MVLRAEAHCIIAGLVAGRTAKVAKMVCVVQIGIVVVNTVAVRIRNHRKLIPHAGRNPNRRNNHLCSIHRRDNHLCGILRRFHNPCGILRRFNHSCSIFSNIRTYRPDNVVNVSLTRNEKQSKSSGNKAAFQNFHRKLSIGISDLKRIVTPSELSQRLGQVSTATDNGTEVKS